MQYSNMPFVMSLLLLAEAASAAGGPVRHYVRTNSDGSAAERVVVYAPDPGRVAVFKGRNRCADAAFVTGMLDPESGQAIALVGGRLTRQLGQNPMAWLSRNAAGDLALRLDRDEAGAHLTAPAAERWVLYDFDFSDMIAHPPAEILRREDFGFDLPRLMMGDNPGFSNLGRLELTFRKQTRRGPYDTLLYRASGPAMGGKTGRLWFDARDGRLVEAILPVPNHAEYHDFHLTLTRAEQGEAAWQRLLADHWQHCPAEAGG